VLGVSEVESRQSRDPARCGGIYDREDGATRAGGRDGVWAFDRRASRLRAGDCGLPGKPLGSQCRTRHLADNRWHGSTVGGPRRALPSASRLLRRRALGSLANGGRAVEPPDGGGSGSSSPPQRAWTLTGCPGPIAGCSMLALHASPPRSPLPQHLQASKAGASFSGQTTERGWVPRRHSQHHNPRRIVMSRPAEEQRRSAGLGASPTWISRFQGSFIPSAFPWGPWPMGPHRSPPSLVPGSITTT
jgi:hypothetical protein